MVAEKEQHIYKNYFSNIKGRISYLRDYILELEDKFNHDLKMLRKKYENDIDLTGSHIEYDSSLSEYYSDELIRIDNIFLRSFRYSAIVGIYSLLETSMNSLCGILKQMNKTIFDLGGAEGDGIEGARLYLMKICKIDLSGSSQKWSEIQKLHEIRNFIIKGDGDISRVSDPEKIKHIIDQTQGLSLDDDHLVIEKQYVESAITWVEDYLQELHKKAFPDG